MKVYIEPHGCALAYGEAELMAEKIKERHQLVSSLKDTEAVVLVTCVVIESTERRMINKIERYARLGKKLVVAGCLPSALPEQVPKGKHIKTLPFNTQDQILETLEELGKRSIPTYHLPQNTYTNIPIATGCLGNCSYCIARLARGRLRSYGIKRIKKRVKKLLARGAKEIRLCAQDTSCYGLDIGESLPKLLKVLVGLEGEFRIRVGMMNPKYALPILDKLVESYQEDKIYKFLHLPVQSGSEEMLRSMNRRYTIKDFRTIVDRFRQSFTDLTFSTDIIAGFPGESTKDFAKSLNLLHEVKPDIVNIKAFSPRARTLASTMPRIDTKIVKQRTRQLTRVSLQISKENLKRKVGERERILVVKKGKKGSLIARTNAYKPVVLKENVLVGSFLEVKISQARDTYLIGQVRAS